MPRRVAAAVLILTAVACTQDDAGTSGPISPIPANLDEFDLSSPAFEEGAPIPDQYSCNGANVSPPLALAGVPDGAVELLLTLQDPDAPSGVFTHWTVFAIDPATEGFPEGGVPEGALQGANEFGEIGYGGPCPPSGDQHRYIFTLAVLSEPSGLNEGAPRSAVDAVLPTAVATTTLTGVYPAQE